MLDICLLGTAGMMPMPQRFLTSLLLRHNGRLVLFDCGEGTQISMKIQGYGFKNIDVICFTHYHADHISGLPGLLLTIGNSGRTEPLILIGPYGLEYVVDGLRRICHELPFPIEYREINNNNKENQEKQENPVYSENGIELSYCKVDHTVTCFAYKIDIRRKGKFDVKKAIELNLPKQLWGTLQRSGVAEHDGKTYTSDMVMGDEREGITVAYCTDSRPVDQLISFIKGCQLFICEGMYGDNDKKPKALENKHMLFSEAGRLALNGKVSELWLTHFSPSLSDPEEYIDVVCDIFPNSSLGFDRRTKTIYFSDERSLNDENK